MFCLYILIFFYDEYAVYLNFLRDSIKFSLWRRRRSDGLCNPGGTEVAHLPPLPFNNPTPPALPAQSQSQFSPSHSFLIFFRIFRLEYLFKRVSLSLIRPFVPMSFSHKISSIQQNQSSYLNICSINTTLSSYAFWFWHVFTGFNRFQQHLTDFRVNNFAANLQK